MPTKPLQAEVQYQGQIALITLQGEVDVTTEETLHSAYSTAIEQNPGAILLNLDNVEYITSTGMAILVELLAQAHQAQLRLAACGLSNHYREVFQITHMTDFLEIFPDEATALANL